MAMANRTRHFLNVCARVQSKVADAPPRSVFSIPSPILFSDPLPAIRAREQRDHPAVHTGIPERDNSIVLRTLTYSQVQKAVDRLAWHYSALGLMPKAQPGELPPTRIIAVFGITTIQC